MNLKRNRRKRRSHGVSELRMRHSKFYGVGGVTKRLQAKKIGRKRKTLKKNPKKEGGT